MNQIDPDFLARSRQVFATVAGLTLQDIRDRVATKSTGDARRDMLSALDTVQRCFEKPPSSTLATVTAVRDLFASKTAAQVGLKDKRFANVRADVKKALSLFGENLAPIVERIPPAPAWVALLESISTPHHLHSLRRLACYCSAMEVAPAETSVEMLLGYHAALEADPKVKNPRKLLKHTIALWNMCLKRVPGWPAVTLSSPFKQEPYTLPLAKFPASFQADVEMWKTRVTKPDPFDRDAPSRPLSPGYLKSQIRLVVGGPKVPIEMDCPQIHHAERALDENLDGEGSLHTAGGAKRVLLLLTAQPLGVRKLQQLYHVLRIVKLT
jgi:hypothetical protein